MYIIAGLGNPGKDYSGTRHNCGFMVLDKLASEIGTSVQEKKHKGLEGKGVIEGNKVILLKPQTYMNLSGECIREAAEYFKIDPESELIVVYDDISLEPGSIRVRKNGSAGGHNGMKNIIAELHTDNYTRVRIGIGAKPPRMDLADWVLGHFSSEDLAKVNEAADTAVEAIKVILEHGVEEAMNRYNHKNNSI
ncbi:MAG: aminoacyl-tRNA hydrolase [Lachnospiraceae bacterium]|nr:aminoacyl-tRNA hydrolase [Lachnospiraceae bacterium]